MSDQPADADPTPRVPLPWDEAFEEELAAQPHDAFFKRVFSDLAVATAFFRHHLPPSVVSAIRWETLAACPASFIKRTLKQNHSDLLFTVEDGDRPALLHILFEHQTSVDEAMPLRLLGYMVEIWNGWLTSRGLPLPPVVPVVLHQGPDRWSVSCHFEEMFGAVATGMRRFLPRFEHALVDLTRHEPESGGAEQSLRLVLHLMKLARERQRMEEFFDWLMAESMPVPADLLALSLLYALHADASLDAEAVFHKIAIQSAARTHGHVHSPATH